MKFTHPATGLRTQAILATAVAVFFLVSCGKTEFRADSAIPSSAITLMHFDLKKMIHGGDGTLSQKVLESMESSHDYLRLRDEIGLDPLKDVDRVLFGAGPDAQAGQGVAIFEGRFDRQKILEGLKLQRGYAAETFGSTEVHYFTGESGDRLGLFFPADGYLVAVGEAWAPASVDSIQGNRSSVEANEGLQSLLDNLDPSDSFWMVGEVPAEIASQASAQPMFGAMVGDLKAYMLSADLDPEAGVHLLAMVRTGQPGTAANLSSMANLGVAAGKASIATQYPKLSELLGLVAIGTEGNIARLELRCSKSLFEEALAEGQRLAESQGGPFGSGQATGPQGAGEPTNDEHEDAFADDPFFEDERTEASEEDDS